MLIPQPEAPREAGAADLAGTGPIKTCLSQLSRQTSLMQKALLQEMERLPKCLKTRIS